MIYDVNTFDDIINLPIRPQAQFYMRATTNNISGNVIAVNVRDTIVDLFSVTIAPNPNNLRAACLCENGYKVDDPDLRIWNSTNYCNLMFVSGLFTDSVLTKQLLNKIQHPFEESFTISVTVILDTIFNSVCFL